MWFLVLIWWKSNTKKRNPTLCVQIHCTWERSHSLHPNLIVSTFNKSLSLPNPSPSFLFPSLSLSFFALSHRVSIFSLLFSLMLPFSSTLSSFNPSFVWNIPDFTSRACLNCAHVSSLQLFR